MVDQKEKKDCCGCRACEKSCPHHAISMKEDDVGFAFPVIDSQKCTNCGLCERVCGFKDNLPFLSDGNPEIYGVIHLNNKVRRYSTSGGMFTALSDAVLAQNGVVYGACFQNDLSVKTNRCVTQEERNECRGSKYVQCDTEDSYVLTKKDLLAGKSVMYSGTPCQIAGLRSFLHKEYENLLTVETVCHGVPNNRMWHEFLDLLEKKSGTQIVNANFRYKEETGWHHPRTFIGYEDGKKRNYIGEQAFFQLFSTNMCLRESCLYCKFLSYHRPADISLADYWGIERFKKEFDDDKGTSMVLINTPKGQKLFDEVKKDIRYFKSDKEHCYQGRLQGRSTIDPRTKQFWEEYKSKGLEYVLVKYTEYSALRTFLRKCISKVRRTVLKKEI